MKKSVLRRIIEEYKNIKKIAEGDFSEIEELEKNPIQRYKKYLLMLKESRFEFKNEDRIIGQILSDYSQETNIIWCFVYEMSVQKYEECFNETLKEYDKNSTVLVYFDIENSQRYITINKEEQESFESTHKVIRGNLSIQDGADRYYNVRHEFFSSCLEDGQDVAIQKILTKYSKTQR